MSKITSHTNSIIGHLKNPYCEQQTKAQKAMLVFAHIILFPLGIYRLGQIYGLIPVIKRDTLPKIAPQPIQIARQAIQGAISPAHASTTSTQLTKIVNETIQLTIGNKELSKPASTPSARALQNIDNLLSELIKSQKFELNNYQFNTNGSNSEKIRHLMNLYCDIYFPRFEKLLNQNQPENYGALIKQGHYLMQISYAISYYTLRDFEPFMKSLKDKPESEAIKEKNAYFNRLTQCSDCFHLMKYAVPESKRTGVAETWISLHNAISTSIRITPGTTEHMTKDQLKRANMVAPPYLRDREPDVVTIARGVEQYKEAKEEYKQD